MGFTLLALLQAAEVLVFNLYVLKLHNSGDVLLIFAMETLMVLSAVNLGIFLTHVRPSRVPGGAVHPLAVAPQLLPSGVIFTISSEPSWLPSISNVLPLTYVVNGLRDAMLKGADRRSAIQTDIALLIGFCLLIVVPAGATLRCRLT